LDGGKGKQSVSVSSHPRVPNYTIGGIEEKSEPRVLRVSTAIHQQSVTNELNNVNRTSTRPTDRTMNNGFGRKYGNIRQKLCLPLTNGSA
jgi:hypothetical protein